MEKRVTGEGTKRWGIEGIRVGTSDRFGRGRSEFFSMCSPSAMFRTCEMQVACNVRCSASSAKTPPRLIQAYPIPPYLGLENSPPSPQTTETPPRAQSPELQPNSRKLAKPAVLLYHSEIASGSAEAEKKNKHYRITPKSLRNC